MTFRLLAPLLAVFATAACASNSLDVGADESASSDALYEAPCGRPLGPVPEVLGELPTSKPVPSFLRFDTALLIEQDDSEASLFRLDLTAAAELSLWNVGGRPGGSSYTRFGDRLGYVRQIKAGEPRGDGITSTEQTAMIVYDPGTDTDVRASEPSDIRKRLAVRAHDSGLYWCGLSGRMREEFTLFRWQPGSNPRELARSESCDDIFVDGREVIFRDSTQDDGSIHYRIRAVSVDGGEVRTVLDLGNSPTHLVGVDGADVFFFPFGSIAPTTTLQAVAKRGGASPRTLTTFERPQSTSGAWLGAVVDEDFVWYLDGADENAVRRVRKTGGAPETLASGASGVILGATTDRCNVYWVTASGHIVGRSKT